MFAVVVTLVLKPGQKDRFMPHMFTNAETSLAQEPGCKYFDIATDPARPDEVFLYELYDDADAFAKHLASPHFHTFDEGTRDMIAAKEIKTYSEVTQ